MTHGISAVQCRDVLRRIVTDELALLEKLGGLLATEHASVVGNDIDALERSSSARQDCVAALMKLGDERRDLCRMLGKGADVAGLSSLLSWCDPQGELGSLLRVHAERSGACREQNERNGALVGARMARISSRLGLLSGPSAAGSVYGPGASRAPHVPVPGRLLATLA